MMPTARRKANTVSGNPKREARNSAKPKIGRPTAFKPETARAICAVVAAGSSFDAACQKVGVNVSTAYRWMLASPDFREDLYRARELRGDWAFGEEILRIADNTSADWNYNPHSGKLTIQKEVILRSKIRIEARQFHMARLHPQQWGERQQIDIKDDWALLTKEERRRRADELIAMIRELREPPPQPPPLVYRPEEPDEEPANPGRIGSRPARSRFGT